MDDISDPLSYLGKLHSLGDEDINLAYAALALAALDCDGISIQRYIHHLQLLARGVAAQFQLLLDGGAEDSVENRLRALVEVLGEQHGYVGDVQSYDDLQNANLVRVIDRAKGQPLPLCILYIHAARMQGWLIDGLNLPEHFVCRLEKDGQRLIFDPFRGGSVLDAADLRGIVKTVLGADAELSSAYYEPVSNRDILIRLQNNLKHRKIDVEDYEGALAHVEVMRLIAPQEYRLLLDAGVLYAKTNQIKAAIKILADYIGQAPSGRDRYEAELLMQQLSEGLN